MSDENEGTAISGSAPEGIEDKGAIDGAPLAELDIDGKPLPFDQHPKWKSARLAEKKLTEILNANDLTDIEELVELVESGRKVKGRLADVDALDDIIQKALTLERYETYWNEQDELKKREDEDPNDTIKRLEQRLKDKDKTIEQTEKEKQDINEAKHAIKFYESEVGDIVKEIETISKDQRPFILEFFGINNPSNEIDITDKKAIKRIVSDGVKKLETFKQQIIKDYLSGKEAIPRISSASVGGEPGKPKVMMKDARKALSEYFKP